MIARPTTAVVLAAGAGTRLGGVAKALLAHAAGDTFLGRIVQIARSVGCVDPVVVVGPPFGDAVAAHAASLGARVVRNPDPARGMASSIALGFGALASGPDSTDSVAAAWLWPVDHPDISAPTLRALLDTLGSHDVARPRFDGRGGHPPLIARRVWDRLAACEAVDGGARAVIAGLDVVDLTVHDRGVVADIDTPADARARG